MAGLAHDLAEHQIGDIPTPTKRNLGTMRQQIHNAEAELLRTAGVEFALTAEEQRQLKLADAMDGMIFCVRERTLGNLEIATVYGKFRSYAEEKLNQASTFLDSELDLWATIHQLWNEVHHE